MIKQKKLIVLFALLVACGGLSQTLPAKRFMEVQSFVSTVITSAYGQDGASLRPVQCGAHFLFVKFKIRRRVITNVMISDGADSVMSAFVQKSLTGEKIPGKRLSSATWFFLAVSYRLSSCDVSSVTAAAVLAGIPLLDSGLYARTPSIQAANLPRQAADDIRDMIHFTAPKDFRKQQPLRCVVLQPVYLYRIQ